MFILVARMWLRAIALDGIEGGSPASNLSLSQERSARTEGERREWCDAGSHKNARCAAVERRTRVSALRLNESTQVDCRALYHSRRHRFAAYADLSLDKERLGGRARRPGPLK